MLAAALAVHGALTAVGLGAYVAAGGQMSDLGGFAVSDILRGSVDPSTAGRDIALAFAMVNFGCGVLALFPVPPLELGVIVWSRLPK